jgi:TRAP transporter 4TM/12TM fusion protein
MKKSGFPAEEAGAVEACASTGGVLMPPVMGAAAFLMAQFLGVPYLEVVTAAVIPSLLYYTGLLVQVDAIAARRGIKGLPKEQIPVLHSIMRKGWMPLVAFAILIYFLLIRQEERAPFIAIAFMLMACLIFKVVPFGRREVEKLLANISAGLSEIIVTIAAVGFIIGSMSLTGVGASLSGELVGLAGGNIYLMLIFGAVASFILGMGMSTSACYIFLAVVLAPGLTAQGMPAMGVHLFILYWAMASNITPPVALACFPASNIAGASYMRVGVRSVTFGFVTLIVPFLFVLQPSIIFQGSTGMESLLSIAVAFVGVVLASFGLAGYVPFIGKLHRVAGFIVAAGGIIIALPTPMMLNIASFVALILYLLALGVYAKRCQARHLNSSS